MMKYKTATLTALFCLSLFYKANSHVEAGPGIGFIENKGQWQHPFLYKAMIPGGAVFVNGSGFVFNYSSDEDLERIHNLSREDAPDLHAETVRHHAYNVSFPGSRECTGISASGPQEAFHHYFIPGSISGESIRATLYDTVRLNEMYTGIDLQLYGKGASLKYDFLVAPGTDAGVIRIKYEGVQPELTAAGHLHLRTTVSEIIESAPYAFQIIEGKERAVRCAYRLTDSQVQFIFPDGYDSAHALVIDPELVFATYSGGRGSGNGFFSFCTTYDAFGNLYAASQSYVTGWPVTTGAFQERFGGQQDVGINKYDATGSRLLYSTYYGGSQVDLPHAMVVNDRNELIVAGSTQSSDLPLTANSYSSTLSGSIDLFIAGFSSDGSRLTGATYMGGFQHNDLMGTDMTGTGLSSYNRFSPVEMTCDSNHNIWVAAHTQARDFPVTANAFQPTLKGASDGVLFRLNPDCSALLYSTFLGGSGHDFPTYIGFTAMQQLVICGGTQSSDFPVSSTGWMSSFPGGSWSAFVLLMDPHTGSPLRSTFLGTSGNEQAVNVQSDREGNLYVLGLTTGNYPVSPGVYSIPGSDVFIDKLTPDLDRSLLSARVGNMQSQSRYAPTGFLVDVCGNIFIAGHGASSGLPVTPDAFQTAYRNFWCCILQPDFSGLKFASYFGAPSDHTHTGSHRMDARGNGYFSLCTGSGAFPTTQGSWSVRKQNTGTQDMVSFKFRLETSGVRAGFVQIDPADSACAPFPASFYNTSTVADRFFWDFGDGNTSTDRSPDHVFLHPGSYTVILYAYNDTACIPADTFVRQISVLPSPWIRLSADTVACVNNPVRLRAETGSPGGLPVSLRWSPAVYLDDPGALTPLAAPPEDITYHATATVTGGCRISDSVRISVLQPPRIITPDTVICEGGEVAVRAEGDGRYSYTWLPSEGVYNPSGLRPLIRPEQSGSYRLTASYPGCRDSLLYLQIDAEPVPQADPGADTLLCYGDTLRLRPQIRPEGYPGYRYRWVPADAVDDPSAPEPLLTAYASSLLSLTVSTSSGCSGYGEMQINLFPGQALNAGPDTLICPGDSVQLYSGGNPVSPEWTPDMYITGRFSGTPVVSPPHSATYVVHTLDSNNCRDSAAVYVEVFPGGMIRIQDTMVIYPGERLMLDPESNCIFFSWLPESGLSDPSIRNPSAFPETDTRYVVTGISGDGCIVRDSIFLLVADAIDIRVPNAFSPGSGGRLRPVYRGAILAYRLIIYNRWGQQVFLATDPADGWDGNGHAQGVYVYLLQAEDQKGRKTTLQGNITLLR